jgi:tetrahydromethanopterin S-methyltransferase subunit H
MFKFKAPQKSFRIGKIDIGGQPGENPPVLIGSIFYHKHRTLLDEKKGEIAEETAVELIRQQAELSDKTGIPAMLDVVGATSLAMNSFIDFVADSSDVPFLIDSPEVEVKIAGLRHAVEIGLGERAVYNSFTAQSIDQEYASVKNSGAKSAILLAYRQGFMTSFDRIKVVEETLPKVERAGVSKILIDTFVMDLPSLGLASRALVELKRKLGLPCGCGAHNAFSTWRGLKEKMGPEAVTPCTVTVNDLPIALGADFILYGPVEDCKYVFPSVYAIYTSYKFVGKMKEQVEI